MSVPLGSEADNRASILVVDDRMADREMLVTLLKYVHYRVIEAADGAEALRIVQAEHPDLIISDVLLPGLDGYGLVRKLHDDPSIARTPVIFYTAVFNEREARELARDCGVARILAKPTEPEKILEAVAEVLGAEGTGEISAHLSQFEHRHHRLLVDTLMRQIEELNAVFNAVTQPLVVFDTRGIPVKANPAAAVGYGLAPTDALQDSPFTTEAIIDRLSIRHPDGRRVEKDELPSQKAIHGKHVSSERFIFTNAKGQDVIVLASASPVVVGGQVTGAVSVWNDITEREQLIDEIRKSRDELEIRVEERTAELAKANQELQEFAFVASHDLQEPLRKITAFGERLRVKHKDSLGEEGRDYLDRMIKSAARMSDLLRALLDYSRVGMRPSPFQPTDLAQTARDAVSDMELAIERAEARVEIGELPKAEVDPQQMRQIFQNLIGNALKYQGNCARPVVKIHGHMEKDGTCRIFVEDNGIGFEEKYLDRIFRPFQRLHNRSQYQGTGMGLAICRKIVERHGGTITAESIPTRGSIFIVTLPLRQPS